MAQAFHDCNLIQKFMVPLRMKILFHENLHSNVLSMPISTMNCTKRTCTNSLFQNKVSPRNIQVFYINCKLLWFTQS
nr:hypothetical protein Iba_chr14cCG4020 [Ipomoea batatas]